MASSVDPEDYNINSAKLHEQNQRVLSAQEKAQQEKEDEEALERMEAMFKGKPLPEEWDPNSHPAFMVDVDSEKEKGNPFVEGMELLKTPDPPEYIAETLKDKGNAALKRGPKYYEDAVKFYTEALEAKSPLPQQNAILLCNRAAVQLLRKNWGKVIEDTREAIKLDPSNIKAYYRCARAQAGLQKWNLCVEVCDEGLKVDPCNKELLKEKEAAMGKMKQKEEEIRKREAQKAKELLAESSKTRNVRKAIEERGVRMGECVYGGMVSQSSREAFLDGRGNIHWPLLVIYNEF
ncbi:hypothetical protein GUITHDRAFT_155219, partial [Guillardia theta CCMP2712]